MSLQSRWFRNNLRLQRGLEVDALHVKTGDCGEHVALIQGALNLIERVDIGRDEQEREYYGASTAKAILHYKQGAEL